MKLQHNGRSYFVILPKEIVENVLKWKKHDNLKYEVTNFKGKQAILIFKDG